MAESSVYKNTRSKTPKLAAVPKKIPKVYLMLNQGVRFPGFGVVHSGGRTDKEGRVFNHGVEVKGYDSLAEALTAHGISHNLSK